MRTKWSILACVAAALVALAQSSGPLGLARLTEHQAVAVIRVVNTKQAESRMYTKRYADMFTLREKLLQNYPQGLPPMMPTTKLDSMNVGTSEVTVVVNEAGDRYTVTLTDPEPKQSCPQIFVSNETGVIYIGTALGCEGKSKTP